MVKEVVAISPPRQGRTHCYPRPFWPGKKGHTRAHTAAMM